MKAIGIPGTTRIQINIPKDVQEFLGWKRGDDFIIDQDKKNDRIIITRIKRKEEQNGK